MPRFHMLTPLLAVEALLAVQQVVCTGDENHRAKPGALPRLIYHPEGDVIGLMGVSMMKPPEEVKL